MSSTDVARGTPLYAIVAEFNSITQKLVESGGELTPELEAMFDFNQVTLQTKVDNYAIIDERLALESDYWKAKADEMRKIAKGFESARKTLRDRLKDAMKAMGTDDLRGQDKRFKLSASKPALVIDESRLPKEFTMVISSIVPDREKIQAAIADGFDVPGASLEPVTALRVYANKKE